jgi:hypothetical protein
LPALIFLSFLLVIFGFIWFLKSYSAIAIALFVAGLSGVPMFFKLLFNLETGWFFDANTSEIHFFKKYAQNQQNELVGKFADIAAIYVQGRQNRDRIRTWWNYKVMMLFHSGREEQISDFFDKGPDEANRLAKEVSSIVGCPFIAACEEKVTKIRLFNQNLSADYRAWGWADVFREFWVGTVATMLLLAALTAFVVGLVVIISQ